MSMTKRGFHDQINEPDMKYIDDVPRYLEWQKQQDRMLKENPLSDCCNAQVSFMNAGTESIIICTECKGFCKVR